MKEAINLFIKATDSLRLKLVNENNKILQYISDYQELIFEIVSVESEKDVKQLGEKIANTPFEFFESLLFRFRLFKFKDGHGGFIFVAHNILVDTWSFNLVIDNILKIYDSLVHGLIFSEPLNSYIEQIESDKKYLLGQQFLDDKVFWQNQLMSELTLAIIPGDLHLREVSSAAKRKQFLISSSTMNMINSYCNTNKISLSCFFMCIYSIYISKATNLDDFVICIPVLNRLTEKEKYTFGTFINYLPLKIIINQNLSFSNFVKQMSEDFSNVLKHQRYPYKALLEDMGKNNPYISNLSNIMLSYENVAPQDITIDTKYETRCAFNSNIFGDLSIQFLNVINLDKMNVIYDYNLSKYSPENIYDFHEKILFIINQVLENNTISLDDIKITSSKEDQEILNTLDSFGFNYFKNRSLKKTFKSNYYQLSPAQRKIYYDSAENNSILYNTPCGLVLNDKIDFTKLEKCFKTLIYRHEPLRTYFELEDNIVVQKISKKTDFKLGYEVNNSMINFQVLFRNFVRPFDLTKCPLLRAKLVRLGNAKTVLLIDIHQIIADKISLFVLIDELFKLYNDETLPALEISYHDFVSFENHQLLSGEMNNEENYWLNQFKDEIPVLNLPSKSKRPEKDLFESKKVYSSIGLDTFNSINKLAEEIKVTPFIILLEAYYILLYKYSIQGDIIIGIPSTGRYFENSKRLVGMLENTLALREHINSQMSLRKFAMQLKKDLLERYKYQAYPISQLIDKLNISKSNNQNPLFDTIFTYKNNNYTSLLLGDTITDIYFPDTSISKYELSLEITPTPQGVTLSFEYAVQLFDKNFIENMSKHYLTIINTIISNIDIKISDIKTMLKD